MCEGCLRKKAENSSAHETHTQGLSKGASPRPPTQAETIVTYSYFQGSRVYQLGECSCTFVYSSQDCLSTRACGQSAKVPANPRHSGERTQGSQHLGDTLLPSHFPGVPRRKSLLTHRNHPHEESCDMLIPCLHAACRWHFPF